MAGNCLLVLRGVNKKMHATILFRDLGLGCRIGERIWIRTFTGVFVLIFGMDPDPLKHQ